MSTYMIPNPRAWNVLAYQALVQTQKVITSVERWGTQMPLITAAIVIGGCGGIAIFFQIEGLENGDGWYSPYYSQGDLGDEHDIDEDPERWLNGMLGATDWGEWQWDGPYASIPIIY